MTPLCGIFRLRFRHLKGALSMTTITAEQVLKQALTILMARSDEAQSLDGIGFSAPDKQNTFINNMYEKRNGPYSLKMMLALRRTLIKYKVQLASYGITLPEESQMQAAIPMSKLVTTPTMIRPVIDIVNNKFIEIRFPYPQYSPNMQSLKEEYRDLLSQQGSVYSGQIPRYSAEARCQYIPEDPHWQLPYSPATLKLVIKHFSLSFTTLSDTARNAYLLVKETEDAERERHRRITEQHNAMVQELIQLVPTEFAPGKSLYPHQITGIKFLLSKGRAMVADAPGLGKTLEGLIAASVLQQKYGYKIFVVTTLSSTNDWVRIASVVGASIEVFTWAKFPIATNEFPRNPFVVIFDEAHKLQNLESQQTRKALALSWHPNCRHVFCLTGTPIPNGRSINALGWLLALKHRLVYSEFSNIQYPISWGKRYSKKAKKGEVIEDMGSELPAAMKRKIKEYELKFCGAQSKLVAGRNIWWNQGSECQEEFYLLTNYKEGARNHPDACKLQRRKEECVNLPEKQRIMLQVDVSKEDEDFYFDAVEEGIKRFHENCRLNLLKWIEEYTEEFEHEPTTYEVEARRRAIKSSEAMALKGIYKHASSRAKVAHTIAQALTIVETHGKIVIFTAFKDTAASVGDALAKELGEEAVAYITGDVSGKKRVETMDDFQSDTGKIKVIISTRAGGEAITLTAASYMLLIDRPWTPGEFTQWEDRIHRLGITGTVTIYWLQLPEILTMSDISIDELLQTKEVNINAMTFNEGNKGVKFTVDFEGAALDIILKTKRSRKTR